MGIDGIVSEINHMRRQIKRQKGGILRLEVAGIDATSAEQLLTRMQAKLDGLCEQRDQLVPDARRTYASGKTIHGTPSYRR